MPRQLRIQYEGAIYYLMSRRDRREEIFRDDLDREDFLKTLGAACQKTGRQVHAYCLMSNHFHLGNGIMDARFQSSSPIMHRFVSKVRTDPILCIQALPVTLSLACSWKPIRNSTKLIHSTGLLPKS